MPLEAYASKTNKLSSKLPKPIDRHTNLQRNNRMKRDAQVQQQTSTFEMKRCNGLTTIVLFLLNNCSQPTYDVSWKQT